MFSGPVLVISILMAFSVQDSTTQPTSPTPMNNTKACGSITIKLNKTNHNVTGREGDFIKAIKGFFNDTKKYMNVNVSDLKIGNSERETFNLTFKLCLVYLSTDGFIEDVLLQKVKDGKLLNISIADGENSFTFEALGGSSTSVTPTESSSEKTCGSITIKLKKLNSKVTEEDFVEAIKIFFSDTKKYTNVEVTDLNIEKPEGETFELSFKLCLVHISTDGFIDDVLLHQVKDGKLLNFSIADGENSFSFEVSGVVFSDWNAKEGECKKCSEGGGGPIVIEGKCKPKSGHSCKGLKNTKEVDKCVEYCNAVSRIMISTVVMAIGIALSLSYNIWE